MGDMEERRAVWGLLFIISEHSIRLLVILSVTLLETAITSPELLTNKYRNLIAIRFLEISDSNQKI